MRIEMLLKRIEYSSYLIYKIGFFILLCSLFSITEKSRFKASPFKEKKAVVSQHSVRMGWRGLRSLRDATRHETRSETPYLIDQESGRLRSIP